MMRDLFHESEWNTNLFQYIDPASQIANLVTAPPVKKNKLSWRISYSDKTMTFYHDTSN